MTGLRSFKRLAQRVIAEQEADAERRGDVYPVILDRDADEGTVEKPVTNVIYNLEGGALPVTAALRRRRGHPKEGEIELAFTALSPRFSDALRLHDAIRKALLGKGGAALPPDTIIVGPNTGIYDPPFQVPEGLLYTVSSTATLKDTTWE